MRTALTLAAQLAQRASRARPQQLREPEAASAQRAAELQARFDAERSAAAAALTPVGRDDPWATVCQQDIADMYRTARTWEDVAPSAREAADRIEREVDTRYRIDPTSLERAGALDRPPSPSRPGASAQRSRPTRGAKHSCGQRPSPAYSHRHSRAHRVADGNHTPGVATAAGIPQGKTSVTAAGTVKNIRCPTSPLKQRNLTPHHPCSVSGVGFRTNCLETLDTKILLPSQKFKVPAGTTADGRTYGSILDADQGGPTYDLFAAQATNGKIGYVDRKQYDALQATVFATGTPGEVPDAMKRVDAGELSLPVYDVDGTTEIGEYVLGGGGSSRLLPAQTPRSFTMIWTGRPPKNRPDADVALLRVAPAG